MTPEQEERFNRLQEARTPTVSERRREKRERNRQRLLKQLTHLSLQEFYDRKYNRRPVELATIGAWRYGWIVIFNDPDDLMDDWLSTVYTVTKSLGFSFTCPQDRSEIVFYAWRNRRGRSVTITREDFFWLEYKDVGQQHLHLTKFLLRTYRNLRGISE